MKNKINHMMFSSILLLLLLFLFTTSFYAAGDRIPLSGFQWLDGNGVDVI